MRDVINKNVTEEQLLQTAERVFSRGWQSMKLYFMIGLPTEQEEDVRAIARVGGRARAVGKRVRKELDAGGPPKVTVSVSTHVPKPHTPFQWCKMDEPETVRRKQSWLREEARAAGVELRTHDCDTSWLEAVLARGDRALGAVIERAYLAGARFDSWEDRKTVPFWVDALRAEGIDPATYLGTLPISARLPWDHIDVGLESGFLLREYRAALSDRLSPPCGKVAGAYVHPSNLMDAQADSRKLVCYDCGIACDLSSMREQRSTYLRKLGADAPRPPPSPPVRGPRRPVNTCKEPPRRYRFVYEKIGPAAFLSHLDLIRAIPRVFRRLELPVSYSQGFHPKPDMTFGPALALGVSSLAEAVDVKLTADVEVGEILDELTAGAPEGLRFIGGTKLASHDPPVARVIDVARYAVGIAPSAPAPFIDGKSLENRVGEARNGRPLIAIRRIEGVGKRVDVGDFLRSVSVNDPATGDDLDRAGLGGYAATLGVEVDVRGSGGVKIAEVVEVLFGRDDVPWRAVRTALGRRVGANGLASPLELTASSTIEVHANAPL
jgi:radical SAM-linked protein